MFKHYLTTALRHFRQHKLTTSINVLCLSLGLTCFIVAWGTTAYFGKMDSHHTNAARSYALITTSGAENRSVALPINSWLLAEHLRVDFPQLEAVARALPSQEIPMVVDGASRFAHVVYSDPQFLTVFDLPFTAGNNRTALNEPHSAIISQALAQRVFGTDQVIGRTFRLSAGKDSVTITGVIGTITQPSQLMTPTISAIGLQFDVLVSMDMNPRKGGIQRWGSKEYFTYVVLPRDGSLSIDTFNSQLKNFSQRNVSTDQNGRHEFRARPVADIPAVGMDIFFGGSGVSSMTVLVMLGGLVLLVACLNYANLATAQAATHIKEIALRRTVGASRYQIAVQHLFEGLVLTVSALVMSLLCIAAMLLVRGVPAFISFTGLFATMPRFWLFLVTSVVVVAFVASAYPALVLSRVRPAHALRGARTGFGSSVISTVLVGLQFGFASFLLIAVFVMTAQNKDMKQAVWNPTNDPIVVIANDVAGSGVNARLLKAELLRQPGVSAVGGMNRIPWSLTLSTTRLATIDEPASARTGASYSIVDSDAFSALDIQLLAGRTFDVQRAADVANVDAWRRNDVSAAADYNIVIERALMAQLKFASPQDAIGKILYDPTSEKGATPPRRLHVIGVVENSMVQPITGGQASFYLMNPEAAITPVIRISKHQVNATLAAIEKVWSALAPEVPIKRRFADEQFEQSFQFLIFVDAVFAALAAFASIIGVMGLIGMALHIIRRRTHEIGVRKTLGASVIQILWLLLRSFSKPIVIANLVVWPLVYIAMRGYLTLFAHSTSLTLMPFVLSLAITLLIAWVAVAFQATRAARMNPATVLRYE